MTDKKKTLMYWLVVGVFEIISLLLAIFCIIKFVPQDNYLTGFAFFSIGICVLSGILMVFFFFLSFDTRNTPLARAARSPDALQNIC